MRWNKPRYGDVKVIRKFAILPTEVDSEVRWLEWVTIEMDYIGFWRKLRFLDESEI